MTESTEPLEYILPPIGAFIFFGYMASFFWILWRHPLRLNLGLKMAIRRRWAVHVVEDNQAIIAVQTLRNTQNAAGVFASAAVIIAFFAFQQGSSLTNSASSLQGVKFYCLGGTLVGAFFVFGICIREAEAIGFLGYSGKKTNEWDNIEIAVVPRSMDSNPSLRREMIIANMETRKGLASTAAAHSAFYWAMGLRFFYLAICVGGWIASPIAALVVPAVLVMLMYYLDRSVSSQMVRPL